MTRHDPMRRRLVMAGLKVPFLSFLGGSAKAQDPGAREEARRALAAVKTWGVQYQRVDLTSIIASPLDLVVLDPSLNDGARRFITADEMKALKRKPDGSRRLVIGYLCIGETDVKRWYWPAQWRQRPPAFVGPDNPNWPGSRVVRYWDPQWQAMTVTGSTSILTRILDMGFDGALLDRVDAYVDWERQYPNAARDMVTLVERVAAHARRRNPGFLLIPQNAEHIIENARYRSAIDAINKESLLTGLNGENVPNREIDVHWSWSRLQVAQDDGVRLFATEYLSDPALRQTTWQRLTGWGILPFYGVRALDQKPW